MPCIHPLPVGDITPVAVVCLVYAANWVSSRFSPPLIQFHIVKAFRSHQNGLPNGSGMCPRRHALELGVTLMTKQLTAFEVIGNLASGPMFWSVPTEESGTASRRKSDDDSQSI